MRAYVSKFVSVVIVGASSLALACNKPPAPAAAEAPTLDVTSWTDKSELFMEYPPLVE